MRFLSTALITLQLLGSALAECPNACSSHGKCSAYDMCLCYRNWMANDCSERVCQFGLAHVDSPKGDLDSSSGALSGPSANKVPGSFMYPYGTTEQFPQMVDSQDTVLDNSGHYYMECSNKGLCDRGTGTCECFPGYEGSACQRASCPSNEKGVCSGHGVCNTIEHIANLDAGNVYDLWDQESTMGCICDAGYFGADCSERHCKYGIDPLYVDDAIATPRVANWSYTIYSKSGSVTGFYGNYSIIFYDVFGENWETEAIQVDSAFWDEDAMRTDGQEGHCPWVIEALEALPNDVIPENSVLCLQETGYDDPLVTGGSVTQHLHVTLIFPGNPGKLKQIEINMNRDGPRPTLTSDEDPSTMTARVYADGFSGEFVDLVPDLCEGVTATVSFSTSLTAGSGMGANGYVLTPTDVELFKRCLGDANGDGEFVEDEVFNWDHGDYKNPHLVKLVDADPNPMRRMCNATNVWDFDENHVGSCEDFQPAGFYAPLIFTTANGFRLFAGAGIDDYILPANGAATFNVFTTKGYLSRVNDATSATSWTSAISTKAIGLEQGNNHIYWDFDADGRDATIDCETKALGDGDANDCFEKNDLAMFFDINTNPRSDDTLPRFHNIYTIEKIFIDREDRSDETFVREAKIVLDMTPNFVTNGNDFVAYKFRPSGAVEYVSECSGRGICNYDSGICECFTGYTSDNCSVQNTLAQ